MEFSRVSSFQVLCTLSFSLSLSLSLCLRLVGGTVGAGTRTPREKKRREEKIKGGGTIGSSCRSFVASLSSSRSFLEQQTNPVKKLPESAVSSGVNGPLISPHGGNKRTRVAFNF